MTKKILRIISFVAKAGEVSTAPPIGPLLGQYPIDVRAFSNAFNAETKIYDKGLILKVILTLYKDGTFIYVIKTPPLSFLMELASKSLLKTSSNLKKFKYINLIDLYKITIIKNKDLNMQNLKVLFFIIVKQAYNLGYRILEKSCKQYHYLYI